MTTKATGLCAKSRRAIDVGGVSLFSKFGIVRMPQLKMLENVLNRKKRPLSMLESTFLEDWDEIRTKMATKGHLLPLSGINSELVSIQRVNRECKFNILFANICIVFKYVCCVCRCCCCCKSH